MDKIANYLMFDILPIVVQTDRKKRDVEDDEIHVYDSENNHHAIFKRSIKTTSEANNIIDYMIVDGNLILMGYLKYFVFLILILSLNKIENIQAQINNKIK